MIFCYQFVSHLDEIFCLNRHSFLSRRLLFHFYFYIFISQKLFCSTARFLEYTYNTYDTNVIVWKLSNRKSSATVKYLTAIFYVGINLVGKSL